MRRADAGESSDVDEWGAVGIRLEPAAAIDENQDGNRDSNLIAPAKSRSLANHLQVRSYGEASRAVRHRLQSLSADFEKRPSCSDSRIMLKTGTTLLRQLREHARAARMR
jgi:hypothetical protein